MPNFIGLNSMKPTDVSWCDEEIYRSACCSLLRALDKVHVNVRAKAFGKESSCQTRTSRVTYDRSVMFGCALLLNNELCIFTFRVRLEVIFLNKVFDN